MEMEHLMYLYPLMMLQVLMYKSFSKDWTICWPYVSGKFARDMDVH